MPRKNVFDRMYPAPSAGRLCAPGGLTEVEGAIFTTIVDAHPPAHFIVSDTPLLIGLVRAIAEADEAATHLREEGRIVDGKVSPWRSILTCAEKSILAHVHRLRLSPQGRSPANPVRSNRPSSRPAEYYDMLDNLVADANDR